MAGEMVRRGMGACAPQAVSNLVWAFAVLEHPCTPFLQARSGGFLAEQRLRCNPAHQPCSGLSIA